MDVTLGPIPHDAIAQQQQSPLMQLPSELRTRIYSHALSAYEDPKKSYNKNTFYFRPGHTARRQIDTSLLLACKRIYHEAWDLPYKLADCTYWPACGRNRPPHISDSSRASLPAIGHRLRPLLCLHMQCFTPLKYLECASDEHIGVFLNQPHLTPTYLTLTIRHIDWHGWLTDRWLRVRPGMFQTVTYPATLRKLYFELETLTRKEEQLDSLVQQICEHWFVLRKNSTILTASPTAVITKRWRGSSILGNYRYYRDEVAPETLEYVIKTIVFENEGSFAGEVMTKLTTNVRPYKSNADTDPKRLFVGHLRAAKVPRDAPYAVASKMVEAWVAEHSAHPMS